MISFREAQDFVLDSLNVLAPERLALGDVLGCVMAEELTAREAVPGFTNSSMDGFALRAQDLSTGSTQLKVIGSIYAGDASSSHLVAGQAMRIMTGAPLPDGADCVCMIEQVSVDPTEQTVTINKVMTAGENVRYPGEDIKIGQVLVSPGDEMDSLRLAVLASQGFTSVLANRRLRVGVLSTGNELVRSDRSLTSGEIRDVNGPLLMSLLDESGFTGVDLGVSIDNHEEITRRLSEGVRDCDAVISTGGVSVGDVDHVKLVIGELGGEHARTMRVAIKPAKPFAFATVGERRTPIFGLPGNPVSTRVSFELFVRPALRRLSGHRRIERLTLDAILDLPLPRDDDGKLHFVHVVARVHSDGLVHVERAIRHGSHLLNALVGANAIAMLPDGTNPLRGDVLRVIILDADQLVTESST
jgi:molybdenum cofactor synthesis domain-containing protein